MWGLGIYLKGLKHMPGINKVQGTAPNTTTWQWCSLTFVLCHLVGINVTESDSSAHLLPHSKTILNNEILEHTKFCAPKMALSKLHRSRNCSFSDFSESYLCTSSFWIFICSLSNKAGIKTDTCSPNSMC